MVLVELLEIYPYSDILLRDEQTGETNLVRWQYPWYDHSLFFWQEGNFSCDCNRGDLFFGNNDVDFPCSGNRFTVVKATFPDGTSILIDG